jgi:3'(2'), 5'-bisphosphate nucleotidase
LTTADDHVLARDLAVAAGQLLLDLRGGGGDREALRKSGDRLSHEFLAAELAARRPGDAVLSEEGIDDKARLAAQRVWIVDPLDGTREFGEDGRTDWAVHVALWERGGSGMGGLTVGAVALPAQGRVLSTLLTPGGTALPALGGVPPPQYPLADPPAHGGLRAPHPPAPDTRRPLRLVVSRSRAPQLVRDVAGKLNAELVPCGSAGAKVATVITGETDAYLHAGGFYEWDTAAPVAVAQAAGYHASRIDGGELTYNRENPLLPDILVCRPAIAGLLLAAIREATHAI